MPPPYRGGGIVKAQLCLHSGIMFSTVAVDPVTSTLGGPYSPHLLGRIQHVSLHLADVFLRSCLFRMIPGLPPFLFSADVLRNSKIKSKKYCVIIPPERSALLCSDVPNFVRFTNLGLDPDGELKNLFASPSGWSDNPQAWARGTCLPLQRLKSVSALKNSICEVSLNDRDAAFP